MRISDFQNLQEGEQVALLYVDGVYLGKRREDHQVVLLYQLENFYVEVYYKIYRQHISRIWFTGNMKILDPYLEQIDVEELVSEN